MMDQVNDRSGRRVHRWATGLLVLMAVLYGVGRTLEEGHGGWGFLRAFAEAGMIGALADWFAVVALFRHPLRARWIPHTAIISKRKDEIADNLAKFVEENFLGPVQITARLAKVRLAEKAADWLVAEGNADRLAREVGAVTPGILEALDDEDMRGFLRDHFVMWSEKIPLAPLGGKVLGILTETGRHQDLLEEVLKFSKTMLAGNVEMVEERISVELAKVPGLFGLKTMFVRKTARKIIENVQTSLDEVLADEGHTVRAQFHENVVRLTRELAESPEWAERMETVRREVVENEALLGSAENLWDGLKRELVADLAGEDSRVRSTLAGVLREFGASVARNEILRVKIDGWMLEAAGHLVRSHGHEIGNLIRETVQKWDGAEMSAKLEAQVGADLQFIRINGTLVGGMVGLVLHAVGLVVWN